MKRTLVAFLPLVSLLVVAAAEPDPQPASPLQSVLEAFPEDFAAALEAAPDAETERLHNLAAFPKALREAMLDVACHPDLVRKLQPGASPLERARALDGLSPAVTQAAALLSENPDILQLLQDYPEDYEPAAQAFTAERVKVAAIMDEFEKTDEQALDAWVLNLAADDEARDQIKLAARNFAKQPDAAPDAAGIAPDRARAKGNNKDQKDEDKAGPVEVQMMPAAPFAGYVMNNADSYPALASLLVGQWLTYRNPYGYDWWFHHWWRHYHHHFHHSLLHHDHHRGHRLGELARLNREHGHLHPSKRYHNLDQHAKKYPQLSGLPKATRTQTPMTARTKPSYPSVRPVPNPRAMGMVQRRPPTVQFRTHQASAAHFHTAQVRHGPVGGGRRR